MKKSFLNTVLTIVVAGAVFTSCESKVDKVENAEQNVQDAKQQLKDARQDLNAEYPAFKADAEVKITANDKRIEELRAKLNKPGNSAFDEMRRKKIDDLQKKNADLRMKLDNYEKEHSDWASFKNDFNQSMDDISNSIDDLFKSDKK